MKTRLAVIEEQLRAELSEVDAKITTLDSAISLLNTERDKIATCLGALGVKTKPAKKTSSTAARSCPGQKEVAAAITDLISANGPMDEADLIALTKDRITGSGKSLVGFGLRFGEVRESLLQEVSPGVLALSATSSPATPSTKRRELA